MDQSSVVQPECYVPAALPTVEEEVEVEEEVLSSEDDDESIEDEEYEAGGGLMITEEGQGKRDNKEIVVVYRYTRFSVASESDDAGIQPEPVPGSTTARRCTGCGSSSRPRTTR
jgi:hypothetical protein